MQRPHGRQPGSDRWLRADRWLLGSLLELFGLCTVAIGQPILAVFANDPSTFIFHGAGTWSIVAFALLVVAVPPLVLWLFELAVGMLSRNLARLVHLLLVAVLAGFFAVQLLAEVTDASRGAVLIGSLLLAAGVTALAVRVPGMRGAFRYLAVLAPLVTLWFLFLSPVSDLTINGDGAASGAGGSEVDNPAPIVLIQFDELPTMSLLDDTGVIDEELFPNFARVAGDSTWFRNHTTVAGTTNRALPAILSGLDPTLENNVPTAASHPDNLFTLLDGTYELHATEQISKMCPPDVCISSASEPAAGSALRGLLDEAAEVWQARVSMDDDAAIGGDAGDGSDDAFSEKNFAFPSNEITNSDQSAVFRRFIDSIGASDRPRLDFAHIGLPHSPWQFLPSGARHEWELPRDLDVTNLPDVVPPVLRQVHLVQLQYTDTLLGELIDKLEEEDVYDDSLVVVTADHGVSLTFWPTLRSLTADTYPEVMWTPLFIKEPGQVDGVVDDTPVEIVDILPTIADVIGVDIPWRTDGESAFSESRASSTKVRFIVDASASLEATEGDFVFLDRAAGFQTVLENGPGGGDIDPAYRLFATGEHGALVGRRVEDIAVGGDATTTIRLEPPGAQLAVVEGEPLPASIRGTMSPSQGADVVIAVDGTIGTIASRLELTSGTLVDGLLPEQLLGPGTHHVELYLVEGPPGAEVLHRIATVP